MSLSLSVRASVVSLVVSVVTSVVGAAVVPAVSVAPVWESLSLPDIEPLVPTVLAAEVVGSSVSVEVDVSLALALAVVSLESPQAAAMSERAASAGAKQR
ncbi:MAG: hypothetical protein R3A51_04695 [Nannocystaceae bacterium]